MIMFHFFIAILLSIPVMPREGGAPSSRKRYGRNSNVGDYWIVRLRGR
jgi:hypothetical protein